MSDSTHSVHPVETAHIRPAVAIAILYQHQESYQHQENEGDSSPQFLMQLRDDIPGIAYPGHWGFFGGHLEPGESPDVAMRRELLEEIGYAPPALTSFGIFETPQSIRHVYAARLTVTLEQLHLQEGWDLALFSIADVKTGERFSSQANQVKPIGEPHQKLLLLFIDQWFAAQRNIRS
ncbi:MAG: NUDIX hydrolase [Elainellaceae cyanobacterium]